MGRPEPCVLFAQTFVHPQLDEYVDEVLFAEPVVITACEILELNSSSASQTVSLVGATLPSSFALEVFVQCGGETRFRRLCHPFLYSHSSSNVLEVEAVVTNHLVVRGSYRSLSLVVYGNTAEDLGQFNIEFDDNSLSSLVTSAEGKLEDLPIALRSASRTVVESLSPLNVLSLPVAALDIPVSVRRFLHLFLKMMNMPNLGSSLDKVVSTLVDAMCSYLRSDLCNEAINRKVLKKGGPQIFEEVSHVVDAASQELVELIRQGSKQDDMGSLAECTFLNSEADVATSKQLVDMLSQYFCFDSSAIVGHQQLPQNKNIIWGLSVALFLCSSQESCFHFVDGGGMEQLAHFFSNDLQNSSAVVLLLLGVIEQATRHPIGCEGILGWWPHEYNNIPSGASDGYSKLLKLFLEKQRHDVASLSTYVLHRLRFFELASRYECAVLSVLGGIATVEKEMVITSSLFSIKSLLSKLLKLMSIRGLIEDPSPVAQASRLLGLSQPDVLLSYKSTCNLIGSSNFSNWDVDPYLLAMLKERGFLSLSAALLSSPALRSEQGYTMDTFFDIASTIGAILLSLLTCRSGLIFLLNQPELANTTIDALRGINDMKKEECVPIQYASVLISKGFVCSLKEVGTIVEMHLRAVNAIDRLLSSTPYSDEFLWVLWELCGLSRSDCGRQALLVMVYFPEVISILIEALHSFKESEPVSLIDGSSPINLATFHSAAEIVEVIVTDSTAPSLSSWIGHAMELHKALHSSSPGSIRKDAPTRLLELIDAGVVYHKNGAIGLLRYSALLASGGDVNWNSSNILTSDLAEMESGAADASAGPDINVVDNLGKLLSDKTFDGVALRDSSIVQLTTAVRILAFISENSFVSAALYDEGSVTVVCAILINCCFMLERFSNNYDYLVDDGTEANSTSDLLLERNREQSLVDLLIPSLVLLINLLQKLQKSKEQHRNTKLMNALLRLHREVSPKLAASAADLSSHYPDFALGFGAVCHLVASALTCWPAYDWTPGLFSSLLGDVRATSVSALGPKEMCSLLCLLNDLFPEEGIWLWENGMPLLTGLRKLAVGTLLGAQKEKQVNWYLEPLRTEKLLGQLSPHLDKVAQIIQHYAISALVVIQDMLRVFINRIGCLKASNASVLLRPLLSCIRAHVSASSYTSELDAYKAYRYLDFLSSLMEHPCAKELLLNEGVVEIFTRVLERCFNFMDSDDRQMLENKNSTGGFTVAKWCLPVFKSLSLLCGSQSTTTETGRPNATLGAKDCALILRYLLLFTEILPVGKELLSCLLLFKDLGSSTEGRSALVATFCELNNSAEDLEGEKGSERGENGNLDVYDLKGRRPLLRCWGYLQKSIDSIDAVSTCSIEAVNALSVGCLQFCHDGKSINSDALGAVRGLFGLTNDLDDSRIISYVEEMTVLLSSKISDDCYSTTAGSCASCYNALESSKLLVMLLKESVGSVSLDQLAVTNASVSPKINHLTDATTEKVDDSNSLEGLEEKFLWECPVPDRLSQAIPGKRKLSSLDAAALKRVKGDNTVAEVPGQNAFARNLGSPTVPLAQTRRDSFRQRKPNTSRPPSMHVDDYVARERSVDGGNSNVIAVQRVGSGGGRPPSIHVDEFMARQRERQNPSVAVVGESSMQSKQAASANGDDKEKVNKSDQLKTDLDDDLQGIDIIFDGEESGSDDKLPFPQPDDNLQQPAPLTDEQRSPHSIVEETESDAHESLQYRGSGTPAASNIDENTQSEFSTRMSASRPEMPLNREPSISSEKSIYDQSDDFKNVVQVKTSTNMSGYPVSVYGNTPALQLSTDSRLNNQSFYRKGSPQHASGSRGVYDQRIPLNQPPLPPTPPPSSFSSVQSDYQTPFANVTSSLAPASRTSMSSPSGSAGPHPPLPPMPPPFSASPYHLSTSKASTSGYSGVAEHPLASTSGYGSGLASHGGPPLMPPMGFNRPAPIPMSPYVSTAAQQQNDGSNLLQNLAVPQSSLQSMHQLQPLQPPFQRPPQLPQHMWPTAQSSQQVEQMQSSIQMQVHQLMLQQPQTSSLHTHYQAQVQVQENTQLRQQHHDLVERAHPQVLAQQGDVAAQQQQDLGPSLHEYFKDPKAITSLLSNKEELCRLLEQHPKLMQMLQERLGQQ